MSARAARSSGGASPYRAPAQALFRRLVLTNGAVFAIGMLVLAISPATVSSPVLPTEISVLAIGLAAIIAANTVLLRHSLAPLRALSASMERADLLGPRDRLGGRANGDLSQLIETFDAMLDRLEAERTASSADALAAQEGERRRIARELHDEVGQSLTAALLRLKRVVDRAPVELHEELHEVQDTVRASLDEVRQVARGLRLDVLEDLGLASALNALVAELTGACDVRVTRPPYPDLSGLGDDVELVLYRITQASLTNVARHAAATRVELSIVSTSDALTLRVADDGRGGVHEEGAGIRGMRERAHLVGGRLTISTPRGGGTVVQLVVPHPENSPRPESSAVESRTTR